MSDTPPKPLLVYDRIDANKRETWLLLSICPLVLLPLVSLIGLFLSNILLFQLLALVPVIAYGFVVTIASTLLKIRMPEPLLLLLIGEPVGSIVIAALTVAVAGKHLISWYGASALLRFAGATPVDPHEEPELVRVVENLSIGAGLQAPDIYLMESAAPNAFATGSSPQRAALVVSRGLLKLLNRRELEGVIAHELSHIGNDDIRLTTALAAIMGLATLPLSLVRLFMRATSIFDMDIRLFFILAFFATVGLPPLTYWVHGGWFGSGVAAGYHPMWERAVSVAGAPIYLFFVAPFLALMIRQGVSHGREFLADADAVRLTRDPEGLALALVKIGAAAVKQRIVDEGSVHLYFADPLETSLVHAFFPSHPPLSTRIALLAQMGNGIAASAVKAAREAGVKFRSVAGADTTAQRDSEGAAPRTEISPPQSASAGLRGSETCAALTSAITGVPRDSPSHLRLRPGGSDPLE